MNLLRGFEGGSLDLARTRLRDNDTGHAVWRIAPPRPRLGRDKIGLIFRSKTHVTSPVGKGTTFALYLPLMTQGTPVECAPPISIVGGKERILVLDDERVQLRTAQRVLRQLGYGVATAEPDEKALEIFERASIAEPNHLVILDLLMPGSLNGLETLKELRKRKPTQRALMASGYAPEQMSREAKENGVGWLAKPYTPAELAQAVRNVLGHTK